MAEMQSAEVFIRNYGNWTHTCAPEDIAINALRARDRAIVERIKDRTIKQMHETGLNYSPIVAICDDVLRELGGEQ